MRRRHQAVTGIAIYVNVEKQMCVRLENTSNPIRPRAEAATSVCVIDTRIIASRPRRCPREQLPISLSYAFNILRFRFLSPERSPPRYILIAFAKHPRVDSHHRFRDRNRFPDVFRIVSLAIPACPRFAEHRNSPRNAYRSFFLCVGFGPYRSFVAVGLFCRSFDRLSSTANIRRTAVSSWKAQLRRRKDLSPSITILTTKPADTSELLIRHFLSTLPRGEPLGGYKISNFIPPPPPPTSRPLDSQTRANIDYRPGSFLRTRGDSPRIDRALKLFLPPSFLLFCLPRLF